MEDKIIIGGIEVDSSEGIVLTPNSTGYRREICKNFGKISCRDSYVYENGGFPGLKTCSVYGDEKNFTAYSELSNLVNIGDEKVFGFFYRSIDYQDWYLASLLEESFYKNLEVQECFGENNKEKQQNISQNQALRFSSGKISEQMSEKNISSSGNFHKNFIFFSILIVIVILLGIIFKNFFKIKKSLNKSP